MPFPGAKTTLYEPGIRLPLVIRSPDQGRKGVVCNAMVTWADITPTLLAYASATLPASPPRTLAARDSRTDRPGRLGRDLRFAYVPRDHHVLPDADDPDTPVQVHPQLGSRVAVPAAGFGRRLGHACRPGRTRRTACSAGAPSRRSCTRPRHELYDLEKDPAELVNLAGQPEHAALLAELQAKLRLAGEDERPVGGEVRARVVRGIAGRKAVIPLRPKTAGYRTHRRRTLTHGLETCSTRS